MQNRIANQLRFMFLASVVIVQSCTFPAAPKTPNAPPVAEPTDSPVSKITESPPVIFTETVAPEARTITALIRAKDGGIVELPGDTRIEIPPYALTADTEITISIPDELSAKLLPAEDGLSWVREITLGSGSLTKPVTLTFSYKDFSAENLLNPEAVFVAHWDGTNWNYLGGKSDPGNKTIAVQTDHFSSFGLFGLPKIDNVFSELNQFLSTCSLSIPRDPEWSNLVTKISQSKIDITAINTVSVYLNEKQGTFSAIKAGGYIIADKKFFERESEWLPAAKRYLLAEAILGHELSHLVYGNTDLEVTNYILKKSVEGTSLTDFMKVAGIYLKLLYLSIKAGNCYAINESLAGLQGIAQLSLAQTLNKDTCAKFQAEELRADENGAAWAGAFEGDVNAVGLVFSHWAEAYGGKAFCTHPSGEIRAKNVRSSIAMGSNGGIFGKVTIEAQSLGAKGEAIAGVKVAIDNRQSVETDENGQFLLTDLFVGTHNVTFSKQGYETMTKEIEIPFQGLTDASVALAWMPEPTEPPVQELEPVSSLRGMVPQKSSCRYGPSQYHLYKTGFKPQAPVKIIGRDAGGDWLQIELSGKNTPCWINAKLVQVEGDIMALPDQYPPDRRLPISDAFPQITLISASPVGNGIAASWDPVEIRIDLQQTGAVEYIIEVWTCMDGKPGFYAVGTNDTVATFQIDNSCGIASYAHVIGQDEHGFSFPTKIPLP